MCVFPETLERERQHSANTNVWESSLSPKRQLTTAQGKIWACRQTAEIHDTFNDVLADIFTHYCFKGVGQSTYSYSHLTASIMENWVWDADSVHTLFSEQLVEFFLNIFYILIFFPPNQIWLVILYMQLCCYCCLFPVPLSSKIQNVHLNTGFNNYTNKCPGALPRWLPGSVTSYFSFWTFHLF